MPDIVKGSTAGFIATLVVTILMMVKGQTGVAPDLNLIDLQATAAGTPDRLLYGWLAYFVIGTLVWGGLFGIIGGRFPGNSVAKGTGFGMAAWLAMMMVFFPLVGHSVFGVDLSLAVPFVSFANHLVFGLVLGAVYQALRRPEPAAARYN